MKSFFSCRRYLSSNSNAIRDATVNKIAGRKRFYKHVGVARAPNDMFMIQLDGATLRTPARNDFHLPREELAVAVALEWDAQTNQKMGIEPVTMPLTTLASTAIDLIHIDSSDAQKTCLSFLPTDTALFMTSAEDRLLLQLQKQHFRPLQRWAQKSLGLDVNLADNYYGKIKHSEQTHKRLEQIVSRMDSFTLACLQSATMECKSIIIALALILRYVNVPQAIAASRVEEEFQIEIWGVVEGGHDMDRLNNKVNLASVDIFMHLYLQSKDFEDMKNRLLEIS